ncbi:16S rRNA (guanine(527)-N(7))-methyltransferase RsmG [Sphingosinicella sp.]|uniref:16S rRNA (guanine(527)-N(7))-methyltransferase RsmG n=1 Tax=Sphingosinicella sp. TaxID=1917971 RepID=UPI0040381686
MDEAEARGWLRDSRGVSRETLARLAAFGDLLRSENERQNLVSAATLDHFWARHVVDSAQLLRFATESGAWLDLGTGAGFPGLVVAALREGPMTLIESRRLRVAFLHRAAAVLKESPNIVHAPIERVPTEPFAVISARAFAPLPRLLELAHRFSTEKTLWLLPKGRGAKSELEAVRGAWQGDFRLEPSLTDADANIIVATGVRRRPGRSKQ